jgi:hypothetical protein
LPPPDFYLFLCVWPSLGVKLAGARAIIHLARAPAPTMDATPAHRAFWSI